MTLQHQYHQSECTVYFNRTIILELSHSKSCAIPNSVFVGVYFANVIVILIKNAVTEQATRGHATAALRIDMVPVSGVAKTTPIEMSFLALSFST